MSGRAGWREVDANAHAAMTAFFCRTGREAVELTMPFDEMMRADETDPTKRAKLAELLGEWRTKQAAASEAVGGRQGDALQDAANEFYDAHGADLEVAIAMEQGGGVETASDYDVRQRQQGVRIFFRYLTAKGWHPAAMLRQLAAMGRALHEAPFHELSMGEAGLLLSETKAAHSWRCKVLSREIKVAGMSGTRLPGQKSDAATRSYKACRKGNQNRKGGKKILRTKSTKNQNTHED